MFDISKLKDYGQGLSEQNGAMGRYHSFEGDILLTAREEALLRASAMNDGPLERKPRTIMGGGRSGMRHERFRWPDGVLRYQLGDTFSEEEKETVRRVLQEFEEEISSAFPPVQNCISFVESDTGDRVLLTGPQTATQCSSTYGYKPLGQVNLAGPCLRSSTIKHELMHSLGIFHQQSRSDRDDHVEILWDNIQDDFKGNFNKYVPTFINAHGVPYDLMSMMHYTSIMASKNQNITIRTLDENAQNITLWNYRRGRITRLTDIELIRRMYRCEQLENVTAQESSWVTQFSHENPMRLRRGNLLTTLPTLPTEWQVSFKLSANVLPTRRKTYSIFKMTNDNEDKIPAVLFHPRSGLRINNDGHEKGFIRNFPRVLGNEDPTKQNRKWIDIKMSQEIVNGRMMFSVIIDGVNQFSLETRTPKQFENVKIFAAKRRAPVFDGWMKMLNIRFKDSNMRVLPGEYYLYVSEHLKGRFEGMFPSVTDWDENICTK